ncbi:MAG: C45 family peptidase, partial [Anaerolineae bacterium]
ALETCGSLADVEARLAAVPRTDGMMLFAVDGKREQAAIFECDHAGHLRFDLGEGWLVGTNHRQLDGSDDDDSLARYRRAGHLVATVDGSPGQIATGLKRLLADGGIEQRGADGGTVYATVACPGSGEVWFTFGGYPAASSGHWQRLPWPWS